MIPTYLIDRASRTVQLDYLDQPTFRVWSSVMRAAFADRAFTPGFGFLFDKRSAPGAPEVACVEAEARFYHEHREEMGRWAFVVKGQLPFGMGRMRAGLCGPDDEVGVFTCIREARLWLQASTKPPAGRNTSACKFSPSSPSSPAPPAPSRGADEPGWSARNSRIWARR